MMTDPRSLVPTPGNLVQVQQIVSPENQHVNVVSTGDPQYVIATPVASVTGSDLLQVIPTSSFAQGGATQVPPVPSQNLSVLHPMSSPDQVSTQQTTMTVNAMAGNTGNAVVSSDASNSTCEYVTTPTPNVSGNLPRRTLVNVSRSSVTSPPPRKRLKLEVQPAASDEVRTLRQQIYDYKCQCMSTCKTKYVEQVAELFFLENGGNMMDYTTWQKRPTLQFSQFLKANALDSDDEEVVSSAEIHVPRTVPVSAVTQPVQLGGTLLVTDAPKVETVLPELPTVSKSPATITSTSHTSIAEKKTSPVQNRIARTVSVPSVSSSEPPSGAPIVMPVPRAHTRQHSISAVYDNSIGSQEQIVEKAKQEAYVVQRIAELQREGMWTEKRLPKVHEPPRTKAHWDYLLEEMVWLAADFAQERKWKKAAAKKCAKMVQKYFQDKALLAQKAEREHEIRLKRIAGFVAKEIKQFWTNVEKLINYKQQVRLEEKRKRALDQHLTFIMDQTEKYSSWVTEGLTRTNDQQSAAASVSAKSSRTISPNPDASVSDDEFQPNHSSDDDEETIAKAERDVDSKHNTAEEIEMLKRESELPIEDLLRDLPADYLERRGSPLTNGGSREDSESEDKDDFEIQSEDDVTDDETTINEQEENETDVNYSKELKELEDENNLPIEELHKKYGIAPESDVSEKANIKDVENVSIKEESLEESADEGANGTSIHSEDESISDEEEEEEEEEEGSENEEVKVGLSSLLDESKSTSREQTSENDGPSQEIADVAALAESFQPTGNTLSSTNVVTKIPFLLRHKLREYQHIGLDWLVTMYNRNLNGILADEMGLGKTIQTIALLGHLACDKGIWGPHLIVVPTSVMLNWEMEIKKWCPSFKILTYYGTQKERKSKRIGWTKPNAFHVCITSYKLVIQDHQSFRRKKWRYLILDEAQNIKNFKSQRWQLLLNFQSQRRLLLTGTPLQNNLMELWSLMHFLMPLIFHSQFDFKEWFSNPVTGMIEGSSEYNESVIKRLHKVLRPFLLRRLKCEVEKQLPKKYEHVVMCRLSKRQRYLYDDYMSKTKTRETLASGNLLSVINILMQLRKVCNHPNLFDPRPTVSPFQMEGIVFYTASLVCSALDYDPFKHVSLYSLNLVLVDLEKCMTAFAAHRIRKFEPARRLIEEIDSAPPPTPRCPAGRIRLHVKAPARTQPSAVPTSTALVPQNTTANRPTAVVHPFPIVGTPQMGFSVVPRVSVQPAIRPGIRPSVPVATVLPSASTLTTASPLAKGVPPHAAVTGPGVTFRVAGGQQIRGYSLQLVQHQGTMKAIPLSASLSSASTGQVNSSTGTRMSVPAGFAQIVQTSTGHHLLLTSVPQPLQTLSTQSQTQGQLQSIPSGATTVLTSGGQRLMIARPANTMGPPVVPSLRLVSTNSSVLSASTASITAGKTFVRFAAAGTSGGVVQAMSSPIPSTSSSSVNLVKPVVVSASPATDVKTPTVTVIRPNQTQSFAVLNRPQISGKEKESSVVRSAFFHKQLEKRKRAERRNRLTTMAKLNSRKCQACPIYGADLIETMKVALSLQDSRRSLCKSTNFVNGTDAVLEECDSYSSWTDSEVLQSLVHSPEDVLASLKDIITKFAFCTPAVTAPMPKFHVSHPPPSKLSEQNVFRETLHKELSPRTELLHPIVSAMATQFPDPRLIQYDCGKLQVLDQLLRQLKTGHHRVLIFTQMTRMLDVLEAFLNYHGHIYLRLDGTTKVDQRQILMERFNNDRRIFVFILSTRSGGIGVNLTGADTVIFYDSDWNPTMDAQAQDRCHRIGQTRDVHIYRLISEKTIEENILKKANQKRLLGDLAIEGGNFTTAYFKTQTIQDLFNVDVEENDPTKRMAEVLNRAKDNDNPQGKEDNSSEEKMAIGALESALACAEDETDVQATKTAKAEAAAELAEFDENIPIEDNEASNVNSAVDAEASRVEQELQGLVEQLKPVERYAMRFMEDTEEAWSAETLAAAEAEIEQQKREWEQGRIQAMQEEEERQILLLEDDPITYSHLDAHNQIWLCKNTQEIMPMWCPPTPPHDENDLFIDYCQNLLYDSVPMSESHLPPVYVRKERIRHIDKDEFDGCKPPKIRREDTVYMPRSFFDRPTAAMIKMRRDIKNQKSRGIQRAAINYGNLQKASGGIMLKPPQEAEMGPDWLISEDWCLLQVIQTLLALPLNLIVIESGHTPNWSFVANLVNTMSHVIRTPKQCKIRYECVILPREEGRIVTSDVQKKKKVKVLKLGQTTKSSRPVRTEELYLQDGDAVSVQLTAQRLDRLSSLTKNRPAVSRPQLIKKNMNHPALFSESGISYDTPSTAEKIAKMRQERINQERVKTTPTPLTPTEQRLQQVVSPIQPPGSAVGTAKSVPVASQSSPVSVAGLLSPAALLATTTTTTTASIATSQAVVVGLSPSTSSGTLGTVVTISGSLLQQPGPSATVLSSSVRAQRPLTTLTVQDMVAAASRQGGGTGATAVVTMPSLAQVQAAARLGTSNIVSVAPTSAALAAAKGIAGTTMVNPAVIATSGASKTLTPTQLNYYRQQYLRQKTLQLKRLQASQGTTALVGPNVRQKVAVAVANTVGAAAGTPNVGGIATVQVSQGQQRTQQIIRPPVGTGKPAAFMKRQQQLQQQKTAAAGGAQVTQVHVPTQAGITPAQLIAQVGLQNTGTSGAPVAALVKTVSAPATATAQSMTIPVALPQVRGQTAVKTAGGTQTKVMTPASQQQIRQIALQQQLLQQRKHHPQQKVAAQLAQMGMKGGPTQLIVQQGQKQLPTTVTVQQIQQVIKQVPQVQHVVSGSGAVTGQLISHQGLAKAPVAGTSGSGLHTAQLPSGQTVQARVIPVSATINPQAVKQIQALTAGARTAGAQNITIDPSGRAQVANTSLASVLAASNAIRVATTGVSQQQAAILSQVTAALQGQPVSVAVRTGGQNTMRIQGTIPGQGGAQLLNVHQAPNLVAAATVRAQQQQQQQQATSSVSSIGTVTALGQNAGLGTAGTPMQPHPQSQDRTQ